MLNFRAVDDVGVECIPLWNKKNVYYKILLQVHSCRKSEENKNFHGLKTVSSRVVISKTLAEV